MQHPHWTRGRVSAIGFITLAIIGLALWGAAAADTVPSDTIGIRGFGGAPSRVFAGVDYDFFIDVNQSKLPAGSSDEGFTVVVYGGTHAEINAAYNTAAGEPSTNVVPLSTDAVRVCQLYNQTIGIDTALGIDTKSGYYYQPGVGTVTATVTGKFRSQGDNYVFAFLIPTNDYQNLSAAACDNALLAKATRFNVEKNWGCNRGICIVNVNPQNLPSGSNGPSRYRVYVSNMDQDKDYFYISGRFERDIGNLTKNAVCEATMSATQGGGAVYSHSLVRLDPEDSSVGRAYLSDEHSVTFNSTAANKRIVAFVFKVDNGAFANATPANICSETYLDSYAGWTYDSNGTGTGGTINPSVPGVKPGSVDTTGGFVKTSNLNDETVDGPGGTFLTGVCAAGSNIQVKLSDKQGVIDLDKGGLMGICTLGIGGQVLKLLLLLGGFFLVTMTILSGVAMIQSTDASALEQAKKNLLASLIGTFLIVFANWLVPAFISLIVSLFR